MKTIRNSGIFILMLSLAACGTGSGKQAPPSGKLKRDLVYVSGKVPGRVEILKVREGEHVKKGDTLAILSVPEAEAKLAQAEGARLSADAQYQMTLNGATENQLKQLDAKYAGLEEQYHFAEKSLNRLSAMLKDSLISRQRYDEAFARYQGAKAQFDAVKAEQAEARSGVRYESKEMALGQKKRALGAYQEVQTALQERILIAPCDMTVETISLHVGELLLPGYSLISGYMDGSESFRFTLPESEVKGLQNGTLCTVKTAFDNKELKAEVVAVRALAKYADISSTRPEAAPGQSVFEIVLEPQDTAASNSWITNSTVYLIR
ncbi:MAG: biotin/lipoyl-binding protein [Bacteroidia bacterium]|nr:biotin/lipoyl-binding protein [Bacteroidia bacterium]